MATVTTEHKPHSELLVRVELCSDAIHPAAAWYREDVPRLIEQYGELQRWAQQVHDALDGRAIPHPDEGPARIIGLLEQFQALHLAAEAVYRSGYEAASGMGGRYVNARDMEALGAVLYPASSPDYVDVSLVGTVRGEPLPVRVSDQHRRPPQRPPCGCGDPRCPYGPSPGW